MYLQMEINNLFETAYSIMFRILYLILLVACTKTIFQWNAMNEILRTLEFQYYFYECALNIG